jgi:hypothetical protein
MGIINKISAKLLVLLTSKKYRLKREIRQTIKVYELACKHENANIEYYYHHKIQYGICNYCAETNKLLLKKYINNYLPFHATYITATPSIIQTRFTFGDFDLKEMKIKLKNANMFRVSFLKNQLKEL